MNGIQENQKCEYVQNASRRIGIKQRGNDNKSVLNENPADAAAELLIWVKEEKI
jgi:hypothetical protein